MAWIAGLAVLAGPAFTATKPEGVDPCGLVSDALDEGRILNLAVAGGDAFEAGRYQGNMASLMRTVLSRN